MTVYDTVTSLENAFMPQERLCLLKLTRPIQGLAEKLVRSLDVANVRSLANIWE